MQINLKKLSLIPFSIAIILIVQASMTLSVMDNLQMLSYGILGLTIVGFLVLLFLYLREKEVYRLDMVLFFYYLLLLVFTILNGTDIKNAVYRTIEATLLIMLLHYFRHRLPLLIQAFAVGFSIAVYCNAVNMALHPEWLFTKEIDGFLLGVNYNQMGCRLICAVITNILCLRINKWWIINVIFLTIIAIATLLLVNSMTSFSCLTLFVLLCFVPSVQLKKIFAIGIFAFVLLFEFVVVFSGESLANNELAVYIIVDVLGKDITFTLRTELWDAGMKLFAESPFIGYGLVDNEWYRTHMVARAIGPHNMILGIMINGGLTLLTLMGMYITVAVKNSYKQIDNMLATLLMGIGFCFMMMTMEVYPSFFLFYLFALVYYYPQLQGIIDSKKSKK